MTTTSSISNSATIASDSVETITITPSPTILKDANTITNTFTIWQQKQVTKTYYVTPACTIPRRQKNPDPWFKYEPTKVALPDGIASHDAKKSNWKDQQYARKHIEERRATTISRLIRKRAPDPPTLTKTTTVAGNTTTTYTASPTTTTSLELETVTSTTTLPPSTIYLTGEHTVSKLKCL